MSSFATEGVEIVENVVPEEILRNLRSDFDATGVRVGSRPFSLSATTVSLIRPDGVLTRLANRLAGRASRPVRALAFDKTPEANWHLPWHQDRVIAVREKSDVAGFGNWTVKGGQPHVEPPVSLLEALFSLRLHLDDNDADNGALKVIPGSHRRGRLSDKDVRSLADECAPKLCTVSAGGVVAMRALTIHASDASRSIRRRRVLHIDYCWEKLPPQLTWALGVEALRTRHRD